MRFSVRIAWILVLSLSVTSGATADYKTSYGKGLEALDKELWSEAADWFQKAIEERPEAGGKVSVSGKRHLYVPYFHLGLALYHADALREASEAWRKSAAQGVLARKRKKMQEQVHQYLFDIEARLAEQARQAGTGEIPRPDVEPQPKLSEEEIEARRRAAQRQLDRADRQIAALDAPDLRAALDADPSLSIRRDQGIETLRQAREIYERADESGDPIALQEVHALAVAAAGMLEGVVFSATRLAAEAGSKPGPPAPKSGGAQG